MKNKNLYNLCFCAIMIALSTVLSFAKIYELPLGGSVTLCSMLPIIIVGYFLGIKWGLLTSFICAALQAFISLGEVMSWGLSTTVLIACILLDYIGAYTILGLSGIFNRKKENKIWTFLVGMIFVVLLRFIFHIISGIALFSSWAAFQPVWLYSICYNGSFLGLDLVICIVGGALAFKPICKLMKNFNK